jgi:hypothetical protein
MKKSLVERLAILVVCLILPAIFCLALGIITDNQVVRKAGSLLIALSVILSCLPLLASAIYRVLEATRRR